MSVTATDFGRVAVLMGGRSAEREVSLVSGQAVLDGLLGCGVDAHGVDAKTDVVKQLQEGAFNRAFIVLHGRGGEDGVIQGALETLGLPYTGSGVAASSLGMDKYRCKLLWKGLTLPTAPFVMIAGEEDLERAADLGFPLMVKPSHEGSSIGMARVENRDELRSAWLEAAGFDTEVMAEGWLSGPEYTAAVVDGEVLPLIRVETPNKFYDYEAKYQADTTRYHLPCGLEPSREQVLAELALSAFDAVGCEGWGRVDMLMSDSGAPQLLEVNTVPGMTSHSLVPMAAKAKGIDFDELVWRILATTLSVKR
ncbi:MAG: D-alanine--D-alanine ligase [Candidatus Sedimenticola sp. (ex Thyasira tokunagai)]